MADCHIVLSVRRRWWFRPALLVGVLLMACGYRDAGLSVVVSALKFESS